MHFSQKNFVRTSIKPLITIRLQIDMDLARN